MESNPVSLPAPEKFSYAHKAMGAFLFFGASMAMLAAVTLIFPGTFLDRAWELNPRAHSILSRSGWIEGVPFLCLAFALGSAGAGWFRRLRWAWRLAVVIIALQVVGSFVNILSGQFIGGAVGLLISSALLFYLVRPQVRSVFVQ